MRIFTKQETTDGKIFEHTYRERIMQATPKAQLTGCPAGKLYDVFVNSIFTGKVAIYKTHKHFSDDHSGYITYSDLSALEQDFEIKKDTEIISSREIKNDSKPIVKVS
jgi:hypothetical protein